MMFCVLPFRIIFSVFCIPNLFRVSCSVSYFTATLWKGKNGPKWQTIMSVVLHISGTIHRMIVIYGTQVLRNDNISRHFFSPVFQNFDFLRCYEGGGKGGERAKNCPKWQQILSVTLHIIIWSSFMLDLCKVTISSSVFFNFWKFWFSGLLVVYKCKKWYKMTKNDLCRAPYLRNHTWYDCHLW